MVEYNAASACVFRIVDTRLASTVFLEEKHFTSSLSVVRNVARALRTEQARAEHQLDRFLRRDVLRNFLMQVHKHQKLRFTVPVAALGCMSNGHRVSRRPRVYCFSFRSGCWCGAWGMF